MKTRRLAILVIGLAIAGISSVYAQSKKDLNKKIDSLEKALSAKNESLVQLQIKSARLEGAAEVHNEEIRRLENKNDSLKEAVITGNAIIENQSSKIAQLNGDANTLRAQLKEWTSRNDALLSELEALKAKPGESTTAVKGAKPADPPKEEAKNGNVVSDNKKDPGVKN